MKMYFGQFECDADSLEEGLEKALASIGVYFNPPPVTKPQVAAESENSPTEDKPCSNVIK